MAAPKATPVFSPAFSTLLGSVIGTEIARVDRILTPRPCANCDGTGLVVAGSWSDVADRRCPECRGTGRAQ